MEMVVYGLQGSLGMDRETFSAYLSNKEISIVSMLGDSLPERLVKYRDDPSRLNGLYTMRFPNGKEARMHIRFSLVPDEAEGLSCIMSLTPATA